MCVSPGPGELELVGELYVVHEVAAIEVLHHEEEMALAVEGGGGSARCVCVQLLSKYTLKGTHAYLRSALMNYVYSSITKHSLTGLCVQPFAP